jgi:hypothetical protein
MVTLLVANGEAVGHQLGIGGRGNTGRLRNQQYGANTNNTSIDARSSSVARATTACKANSPTWIPR